MILPKNGRVVVIDDDTEYAIPLIKSLSKEGRFLCTKSRRRTMVSNLNLKGFFIILIQF